MRKLILILGVLFMACNSSSIFLVIGHRGAMGYETENTIASIEKAIELDPHIKKLILIDDSFHCLKENEAFKKLFNFKKFLIGKTTI